DVYKRQGLDWIGLDWIGLDWIIILGAIATTATVFSQVTAVVKNIVDTYYKVKEEKQKSRPDQGNDSE
ncbi:hypothetical protein JDS85_15245, partial [Bacillus cereus]|uniref:hypothetical protein n=1 Tax=Bacillus cereus TaxID=1396 RepID=UPI0018F49742